jgi:formylglycine-generating enzyme required for sulfatase activity
LLRGGRWSGVSDYCRASQRLGGSPGGFYGFGFRVVRTP